MSLTVKRIQPGDFPGDQWLRLLLPVQGLQVRSLVGELRSYMSPGKKKKKKKKKKQNIEQNCNKSNKDFKKGST